MKLLALSGSLRRDSFNSGLLRAAMELGPAGVEWTTATIGDLPLYNGDLTDPTALAPVERFKAQVGEVAGVLIATPEYNYGIPGPLKNAIDWASRPAYQSVFRDKPVAVVGAAMSAIGSARAQGQLKQVLLGMASQVFPHPEFLVGLAPSKFTLGALTDSDTRTHLVKFLELFTTWCRKVG